MAKNFGRKGMTEEELRLFRLQQRNDAIRAKQMSDEEYGKKYARQMGLAHPEAAPRGFFGDLAYKAATSNLFGAPANTMENAGIWAEQQIEAQEGKQAAQAMAAKYNAQNNYGDESADFDANGGYKMGYMGDGNMMPGGPTNTTFVPDETKGVINTTANAAGWLKKYFGDLDSPTKGVCTLPGGTTTQQLDRAACDAAGGTFNSPQLIYDAVLKKGEAASDWSWDKVFNSSWVGGVNVMGQQLAHIKDAITGAQMNDNKMQKAGMDWTPDKIAWIEKYGINNLPGTQRDDTGGDTKATAVGRDTVGKFFSSQEGLLSPSQLEDRYPKRYSDNAAANQGIWDDAIKAAEGRDVTGVSGILPPSFMESEKARIAALQQGTDARFDRRMGDDGMAAASIWADKAIDAEEQRIANYNAQINNPTSNDIAPIGAIQLAKEAEAKAKRMAAIQAGIDADAGRTTQENYELYSGEERKITPNNLLDSVTEVMQSNDEWAEEKAETIKGWIAGAQEGIITWGSIAIDKVLDIVGGDGEALTETEANNVITEVENLAEQSKVEATTEVKQDGLLVDSAKTTTDGLLVDPAKTTTSAVSGTSIFTATADDSTEGFTMDRLKNPLSAENKAWWLGGGGGIPGNNRAVEFFNTLAYIGTPLKYRPSQTPSESLQDRKIKHMNNQMDYAASVASSAASANQNTFTKLKAAVPSQEAIAKSIEGEFYEQKGFFEKSSELDRRIQARAGEIREKMLIMASEGIYPTKQKVYDDEEAERKRIEAEKRRIAEEEERKNPKPENEESWWSDLWPL